MIRRTQASRGARITSCKRRFIHVWPNAFNAFRPAYVLCAIYAMNALLGRVSYHASHRSPSHPHRYNRQPLTVSQLLQHDMRWCRRLQALRYDRRTI